MFPLGAVSVVFMVINVPTFIYKSMNYFLPLAFFSCGRYLWTMENNGKRGRGRPRLAPGDGKEARLHMRITAGEAAAWKSAADLQGSTVSAWARRILNAAAGS